MAESTIWWLLAGAAVAIELVTGTFYLLMIAIGLAAAAIAGHLGLSLVWQMVTAAVVGGGTVVVWHAQRSNSPQPAPAQANSDVQMDIGETVKVTHWNQDATASVHYRGAHWTVVSAESANDADSAAELEPGFFKVTALQGNRLVVKKL